MKVRLLLGLLLSGLLCGCAANTPYSETVVDTNKHTQQRGLPETPCVQQTSVYPGIKRTARTRKPLLTRCYGRCDRFRGSTVSPS